MIAFKGTREDATELYIALNSASEGFTPANAVAAADNLNLLYPGVNALDKGKNAWTRASRRIAKDVKYKILSEQDGEERHDKINAELEAKQEEMVELELHPLKLGPEEITASKLTPGKLAVIRRWLPEQSTK